MSLKFFGKKPDPREEAVRIFFDLYEQWAVCEYKFLQVPACFKVYDEKEITEMTSDEIKKAVEKITAGMEPNEAAEFTSKFYAELPAELNLRSEIDVLALAANLRLVALKHHMEKMVRDGYQVTVVEWTQWNNSCLVNPWFRTTVADIAPNLGLVMPYPTADDFNHYRKMDTSAVG